MPHLQLAQLPHVHGAQLELIAPAALKRRLGRELVQLQRARGAQTAPHLYGNNNNVALNIRTVALNIHNVALNIHLDASSSSCSVPMEPKLPRTYTETAHDDRPTLTIRIVALNIHTVALNVLTVSLHIRI
eukprot:356230-Prorocentrum_minimum.AAC.1